MVLCANDICHVTISLKARYKQSASYWHVQVPYIISYWLLHISYFIKHPCSDRWVPELHVKDLYAVSAKCIKICFLMRLVCKWHGYLFSCYNICHIMHYVQLLLRRLYWDSYKCQWYISVPSHLSKFELPCLSLLFELFMCHHFSMSYYYSLIY